MSEQMPEKCPKCGTHVSMWSESQGHLVSVTCDDADALAAERTGGDGVSEPEHRITSVDVLGRGTAKPICAVCAQIWPCRRQLLKDLAAERTRADELRRKFELAVTQIGDVARRCTADTVAAERLAAERAGLVERLREALQLVQDEINDVGEDGSEIAFSDGELDIIAKALSEAAATASPEPDAREVNLSAEDQSVIDFIDDGWFLSRTTDAWELIKRDHVCHPVARGVVESLEQRGLIAWDKRRVCWYTLDAPQEPAASPRGELS